MTNQQTHDFMTWTAEQAKFMCRTVLEAEYDTIENWIHDVDSSVAEDMKKRQDQLDQLLRDSEKEG